MMRSANLVTNYCRNLAQASVAGWNRFWFVPANAATLGLIRCCAGAMLVYTHAVWAIDLHGFFGSQGRLSHDFNRQYHGTVFAWTHLGPYFGDSTLWLVHLAALAIFALFWLGLFTRVTSVLAALLAVSYSHRGAGALFGLDQLNALLALYLAVGASGDAYSLDNWLRRRAQPGAPAPGPSVSTNIAVRLIQVHMCLIYAYAGWGKMLGGAWWEGTALWWAFANYEYQSLDMTWTARYPWLINALTHITVCWEISYPALVWPRRTRPLIVALSVPLHLGIAACMGMITFGLIMIVGNLAFVSPQLVRELLDKSPAEKGTA